MSPGLWDLCGGSCQKLESVDFFEAREKLTRVVVRGLGSVENNVDDGRDLISPAGGEEPLWSPDGTELFYWDGATLP